MGILSTLGSVGMDLGQEGSRSMLNRCPEPRIPSERASNLAEFRLGKSDVFFVVGKVHNYSGIHFVPECENDPKIVGRRGSG